MLMPWGAYKDMPVDLLASPYMRYLLSIPKEGGWLSPKLRRAMQRELEARGSEEPLVEEEP